MNKRGGLSDFFDHGVIGGHVTQHCLAIDITSTWLKFSLPSKEEVYLC